MSDKRGSGSNRDRKRDRFGWQPTQEAKPAPPPKPSSQQQPPPKPPANPKGGSAKAVEWQVLGWVLVLLFVVVWATKGLPEGARIAIGIAFVAAIAMSFRVGQLSV